MNDRPPFSFRLFAPDEFDVVFQEISQIEGVERAARHFSSLGGTAEFRRFPGGHAAAA